ncbi:amidase [Alphaproteobacteria bacterium]|nr:amidase [Alphaproteobacteria bacterium]
MTKPFELTASEAIKLIRNKKLSIHEWVLSCFERIKEKEDVVKAWIYLDEENALKKSKQLDEQKNDIALGIPFGIKDIIDASNVPTGFGTPFYKNNIPARDAASVAVAKQSGCVFMGKTVSTELGHRAPGLTTNPHNKDFTPGGSSSGSAAAVASMMAPVCFGTQTTGSVIRPAAYCGVIGYKPTYGDFDKSGILPNSPSIDTLGLMTRSVEDLSLFRSILLEEKIVKPQNVDLKKLKIGFVKTPHWNKTDICTQSNLETFVDTLRTDKLNIIDLNIDALISEADKLHLDISGYEFKRSISFERFNHYDELSDQLRNGRLNDGYQVTNEHYKTALKKLNILKHETDLIFNDIDMIITPSAPGEALEGLGYTGSPMFNTTWSLNGNPCVTLPLFKGDKELPIGCQLVTKFGNDNQLLDYANTVMNTYLK